MVHVTYYIQSLIEKVTATLLQTLLNIPLFLLPIPSKQAALPRAYLSETITTNAALMFMIWNDFFHMTTVFENLFSLVYSQIPK